MKKLLDATLVAMLLMASIPDMPAGTPNTAIAVQAEEEARETEPC